MMDVVVVDVLVTYGMLLSCSRGAKLGGTIQLDLTYANILIFRRETRRLYWEAKFTYTLSDSNKPYDYPVYAMDDMGCGVF